jgi:CHAT domain-containing protein
VIKQIPIFLIFCLVLFCQVSRATVLDSLLVVLAEVPAEETTEYLDQKSILCNDIAIRYQELHDANKARFYFLQSIEFTTTRIELENDWNAQNCYDLAYLYRNLATFESTTGNNTKAELHLRESEQYYIRLKPLLTKEEYNGIMVEFYHSNFTLAYHIGDYEKGKIHLLKVEKMLLETGDRSIRLAENYRFQAELMMALKDYDQCELYAEKALGIYDQVSEEDPYAEPMFVRSYSTSLFWQKKYTKLLDFLENRKTYATIDMAMQAAEKNEIVDLSNFVDIIFIRSFALMRLFEETDNIEFVNRANDWQNAAFEMAENYIVKNNVDKIGNVISNPENKVVGKLICMTYFKEHNLLTTDKILHALRTIDVQQSARLHLERVSYGVNRKLSQKEKHLKNELNYVNLKLAEASYLDSVSLYSDSLSDRAYALSSQIQELNLMTKHDKILEEYQVGQNQFKNLLNRFTETENKDVVTYFYEEENDSLYIIVANPEGIYFEVNEVPKNFAELIVQSYQLNAHLQLSHEAIAKQKELNQALYNFLVTPIADYLITSNLLIYPNNEISYVSFDALMDPNESYMVSSYSIQYTSSLFSIINEERKPFEELNIASYYPSNYGTDSLAYLNNGAQEVNDIQGLMGGELFKGETATKLSFLKIAHEKEVLHLASHSILNVMHPYESYILFDQTTDTTENRLFAHEIFSKTLNCDMVTLSSCNSAKGEIEEGIGVVSLANAFYFSGVPCTISSLWSAQDKSSSKIMVDFYANLKLGLSKSESLRRAKNTYLEQADKIKKQPFFWANYVVYGSDQPLFQKGNTVSWWKYLIGTGLAIVLLILGRKLF